jgi:acyl carrier protein phosphodiesterase
MASRRPRLAALEDSFDDFIDNYQIFEDFFWQFYPRMMDKAVHKAL